MQRMLGSRHGIIAPDSIKDVPNGVNGVHVVNGTKGTNGVTPKSHPVHEVEVLVVGAGFAGCYLLHHLRKANFRTTVVEAGSDLGGIWHWNSYPGARVDSQYPIYAYSLPEVYEDWTWTEQYPGSAELRKYFAHVEKKLDLKRDCVFDTKVTAAEFDEKTNKWTIQCHDGTTYRAQFFIAAIGFAAKRHFPDWEGLDTFKGIIHHSSFWPLEGLRVQGKKMAVVGTGATGIQIAQECAKEAEELTLFQRTPNLCCPMNQQKLTPEEQEIDKKAYPEIFKERLTHDAGFLYSTRRGTSVFDYTPEENEALFEELWQMGGFRFLANNYGDVMTNKKANMEVYKFWRKKVRARLRDPELQEILAPMKPPHSFGAKRLSLEQDFYEQFNKPNIHVVDIKANPVQRVVSNGIITEDGKLHEVDIIALATGFDSITGGLKDLKLTGLDGEVLSEKWNKGTWTYLGMLTSKMPNFFFTYGPQGPTAFSNGPSCVEPQSDWIVRVLEDMRSKGLTRIDATKEAENEWREQVQELSSRGLRHYADSWYMGSNIPGKPREALNYAGGVPLYIKTINRVREDGYKGFVLE